MIWLLMIGGVLLVYFLVVITENPGLPPIRNPTGDDAETDSTEDSSSTDISTSWEKQYEQRYPSTPPPSRSTHASRPTDYETLSSLPTIYYCLAILCGLGLLFATFINAGELTGAEVGYMIGWIFGSALSMFAVGRVIELLQQIRDAVRNIPTLSPGRSDDE